MALPAGVTTTSLTFGPYTDAEGVAQYEGLVGFVTPSSPVRHVATGAVIVAQPVKVVIGQGGAGSVVLPQTDQTSVTPSPFTYTVTWQVSRFDASPGNLTFSLPVAAGPSVDFDLLTPTTTPAVPAASLDSLVAALLTDPASATYQRAALVTTAAKPSGVDDTAALQAAINATPSGGTLVLPAGRFRISSTLTVTKPLSIVGAGCSEVWGGNGYSLEIPTGPDWLTGTVLTVTAAGIDALSITAAVGLAVNLRDFGIVFSGAHAFLNTGHGVHALPPGTTGARGNGLMGARWDNVAVVGHDGNHYAFRALNGLYNTFSHLRGYGGGGLDYSCESSAGNYGNLMCSGTYFVVGVGGTAHGYRIAGSASGWGVINLIALIRPQCNLVDFRGQFGAPGAAKPDAPQATFHQENVDRISIIAPDWEAPDNNATHNLMDMSDVRKRFVDPSGFFKNNEHFVAFSSAGVINTEMTAQFKVHGNDGGVNLTAGGGASINSDAPAPTDAPGFTSDYTRGAIRFGTGTGGNPVWSIVNVAYQFQQPGVRMITLTPGNAATAAAGNWYVVENDTFGFSVYCSNPLPASQPATKYLLYYVTEG